MSIFRNRTSKKIDMLFVLALITLFAATSFALVLVGAKQYRQVTNVMSENHLNRTTSSYLAEKIRQNDAKSAITVTTLQGVDALSIRTEEEGYVYLTYIYYYEGVLRELVVTESSVFSLSAGQPVIEVNDFRPTMVNASLLCIEITNTLGEISKLYYTIHSATNTGKEAS